MHFTGEETEAQRLGNVLTPKAAGEQSLDRAQAARPWNRGSGWPRPGQWWALRKICSPATFSAMRKRAVTQLHPASLKLSRLPCRVLPRCPDTPPRFHDPFWVGECGNGLPLKPLRPVLSHLVPWGEWASLRSLEQGASSGWTHENTGDEDGMERWPRWRASPGRGWRAP